MLTFKFNRLSIHHQAWLLGVFFCVTLAILVNSIFASSSMSRSSNQEFMLNILMDTYSDAYQMSGGEALEKTVTEEFYNTYFIIKDKDGNRLFSNAAEWIVPTSVKKGINYQFISKEDEPSKGLNIRYLVKNMPDGNRLFVGQNITALDIEHPDGKWIALLVLSTMAFAGIASIIFGFFILRRLQSINNTSQLIIQTGDLSKANSKWKLR